MPHVADNSNERPCREISEPSAAVYCRRHSVYVRFADRFSPFSLAESLHQAQQVAVQQDFIFRINRPTESSQSRMVLMAASTITSLCAPDRLCQSARWHQFAVQYAAVIFQQNAGRRSGIATVTDNCAGVRNVVSLPFFNWMRNCYQPP